MAPKAKNAKATPKVTYDYSGLEQGKKVQAECEGVFYAAEVVQVSESKNRTKAPVKVTFPGYDKAYDVWVSGERLRSKALKKTVEKPAEEEKAKRPPLEFTVGYWGIRGAGSVFRMVLEYREAKWTDKQYSSSEEWFAGDKPKLQEKNPLANLPYIECGGDVVCQTIAMLDYVGSRLRLNGAGNRARLLNSQLLCEALDVRSNMVNFTYPFRNAARTVQEFKEQAGKALDDGPFSKFEASLAKTGGDFFCGKSPCTSDFLIWDMLDYHIQIADSAGKGDIFEKLPKCKAFYDRVRALPTLQKYFGSDAYKLPMMGAALGAHWNSK